MANSVQALKQENLKLRKKLKMTFTENRNMEAMVREQFQTIEAEMARLRSVQEELKVGGGGGGGGGSDDVRQLRLALQQSRNSEQQLRELLEAGGGGGAGGEGGSGGGGGGGGGGGAALVQLQQQLADKTAELETLKDTTARKEAATREWLEGELKNAEDGRQREVAARDARIRELEAGSDEQTRQQADTIKKLRGRLAAMSDGGGNQAQTLRRLKASHRQLRQQWRALHRDAQNQRAMIGPAIEEFGNLIAEKVAAEQERTDEAVKMYRKISKQKKRLYNKLQEMRGNIRVYCRVRPLSTEEVQEGDISAVDFPSDTELTITDPVKNKTKRFVFDKCFAPGTTQRQVFEDTRPLITSVLDGYNVCIFAYGQTGSGKTYTMEGPPSDPGINRQALVELFRIVDERQDQYQVQLTVSALEIYNEQVRDLLNEETAANPVSLAIHEGPNGMYVDDLIEEEVGSAEEVIEIIHRGSNNRQTFATDMNEHSSRSHSLLRIVVRCLNKITHIATVGKLTLVDLAGSERVSKSGATDERLLEAQNINKSLSSLGDVISSLSQETQHIPYRNSKLTFLLKDSLGGNSKTLMFVQVSPNQSNVPESVCSLLFAERVASVKLAIASVHTESAEVTQMKRELEELRRLKGAQ